MTRACKPGRTSELRAGVFLLLLLFALLPLRVFAQGRLQDPGKEIVVVIDPGHGGVDSGTEGSEPCEKWRNLSTAIAFANELSQYEGVKVYLTRTEDCELTLKERAEFAASVQADLLVSIHYNASADHSQYGGEIWIPCAAPANAWCYQFARAWSSQITELGIVDRGTKTRINGLGRDYYGILREAAYYGIPAVIIEHCHMDHPNDRPWCDDDADNLTFGHIDATAVARYFGLHSTTLGVDHASYLLPEVDPDALYGEAHYDPNAGESTPPGPLAEGEENHELDSLFEKAKEEEESGEAKEDVSGAVPTLAAEAEEEARASVSSAEAETGVQKEAEPTPYAAVTEEAPRSPAEPAEADDPEEGQRKLLGGIIFAVLLLAALLICGTVLSNSNHKEK